MQTNPAPQAQRIGVPREFLGDGLQDDVRQAIEAALAGTPAVNQLTIRATTTAITRLLRRCTTAPFDNPVVQPSGPL